MGGFLKGTFFLIFVIFFSKILGFIFRIQFMQIAGEEAVGYYMTTYPAFIFFISLVQFGLPIAVTKIVAEAYANKAFPQIAGVMKTVFLFTALCSIVILPLLFLISPFVAQSWLKNEDLALLLKLSIVAIPFVLFASIFKAYLQGLLKITPTAFAQLFEQLLRIGLIIFILPELSSDKSAIQLAAIVMLFTVLSELCSFVILFISYTKNRISQQVAKAYPLKPILHHALPAQGSKLFGTFTWFLEPIVFLQALTASGITAAAATTLYGVISGVFVPLLLFPAFIPAALAIVLIPAVSESLARRNSESVKQRILMAVRLSSLIGCFASTIFYLYGDQLAIRLFHISSDFGYMKILAPIFYFYYIQSPLHSVLQAIGEAKTAMFNSIYGGIGKLFVLFILASQPYLQEKGAIIAIGFGVMVTSLLHLASLKQHSSVKLPLKPMIIPYLLFIVMSSILTFAPLNLSFYTSIAVTILILIVICFATKQIRLRDFQIIFEKLRIL